MRRRPPSQTRRDRWIAAVAITKSLPPTTRLFLSTCLARHMKANGFVSRPRKMLAAEHEISERRVSFYVQQAKEAGWLVVVQKGVRTRTAEYQATFPDAERVPEPVTQSEPEKGDDSRHPFDAEKGDAFKHPLWVTKTSPFPGERVTGSGTPVVVPTREPNHCTGELHTCPCEECREWQWRHAFDGTAEARAARNGLELDSSSQTKSKSPRGLRAVR